MQTPWGLLDKIAGLYFEGLEVRKEGLKALTRRLARLPMPPLSTCLSVRRRKDARYKSTPDAKNPPAPHL